MHRHLLALVPGFTVVCLMVAGCAQTQKDTATPHAPTNAAATSATPPTQPPASAAPAAPMPTAAPAPDRPVAVGDDLESVLARWGDPEILKVEFDGDVFILRWDERPPGVNASATISYIYVGRNKTVRFQQSMVSALTDIDPGELNLANEVLSQPRKGGG